MSKTSMFKIKTKLFCIDLLWKTHFNIPLMPKEKENFHLPQIQAFYYCVKSLALFFLLQIGQKER